MARKKLALPNHRLRFCNKTHVWLIAWTCPVKGYTKKVSTGTANRDAAEAIRRKKDVEVMMPAPPKDFTVGDLLKAYEAEQYGPKGEGGEAKTKAAYYALQPLKQFFSAFTPAQLVDKAWTEYRKWRTKQLNMSASARSTRKRATDQGKPQPKLLVDAGTAEKELRIMSAAIKWAQRNPQWHGLSHVEVSVRDAKQDAKHDYLTRAEVSALLDACVDYQHQQLFILLAIATGARMSAILELTWDKVRWPGGGDAPAPDSEALVAVNETESPQIAACDALGQMHFTGGIDFDLEMSETLRLDLGRGRGNKRRGTGVIALDNLTLYEALVSAHKSRKSNYVIEWRGRRCKKVDLTDAYARAGIQKTRRNHILKHTCCSWLVQDGRSYESIAQLVGTSAKTIEKHYGHLSPDRLATAAKSLTLPPTYSLPKKLKKLANAV